jgi:hypothetical protein
MERTNGYLVEWETLPGRIRDVFFQGVDYANQTAEKCITNGYRVSIRKVQVCNQTGILVDACKHCQAK